MVRLELLHELQLVHVSHFRAAAADPFVHGESGAAVVAAPFVPAESGDAVWGSLPAVASPSTRVLFPTVASVVSTRLYAPPARSHK